MFKMMGDIFAKPGEENKREPYSKEFGGVYNDPRAN